MVTDLIQTRPLGSTGEHVSLLGVGGFHIGVPDESEAIRIVQQAIDAGATFMDNAWDYNDGDSERRMGKALAQDGYRQKAFLMTKDCAHDRRANNSEFKLEQSLKRLQTDYLDLWQIHEVVWDADPERILAPGGSAEYLVKAKEAGKVRFIGFTGHKHPDLMKKLLASGVPWDTVQMPINVFDAHFASFQKEVLPICIERGIAVIGMKSLASGQVMASGSGITAAEAMRYAMSQQVSTLVSGMKSLEDLEANLAIARAFTPMSADEQAALIARAEPFAVTGEYELFKSSRDFDGNEGRVVNQYPIKV